MHNKVNMHFYIKNTEISVVKITVNKWTHHTPTLASTPFNFLGNCTLSSYYYDYKINNYYMD